jgi:hypothetical protein
VQSSSSAREQEELTYCGDQSVGIIAFQTANGVSGFFNVSFDPASLLREVMACCRDVVASCGCVRIVRGGAAVSAPVLPQTAT